MQIEIKYYETLKILHTSKELLLQFFEEVRKDSYNNDKKDKLLCRILRQGGKGLLNRINKRPSSTLFMDINIDELFKEIQDFFDEEDEYIQKFSI